ncbi:MAG: DUF4416 family protein [Pirellulaceae bacterium]|nr:DUF4416 family protein [Pirellulaceae bacterium]
MAQPKPAPPALLLAAIFSCHRQVLEWAGDNIQQRWGTVGLTSPVFEHVETGYYAVEMGQPLLKQFVVLDRLWDPTNLADCKLQSNAWESQLASSGKYPQPRPVNIDPGYLTLSKLVLASAKDRAHRIYLRNGIYAEECLYYVAGWQSRPWTYPDYLREDYQRFFSRVRERLKQIIQGQPEKS